MKIVRNQGLVPGAPDNLWVGEWGSSSPGGGGKLWRLVALGDIGLSGSTGRWIARNGSSRPIFAEIAPALEAADCVMANLETPLVDSWSSDKMFAGSSRTASDLADVGFHVLHLASNHMLDHGSEGFAQTIAAVRNAGMTIIGAGDDRNQASSLVVQTFDGLKVGWLAAGHTNLRQPRSPRLWELTVDELLESVCRHRGSVDLLMASLHWGPMQVDYPYPEQYRAAHQLVDAGASAVLMHHAHVLQGVEVYKGRPICYNLGNCLFDPTEGWFQQSRRFRHVKYEEQITSCLFSLTWQGAGFSRIVAVPIVLPRPEDCDQDVFHIGWAPETMAERILDRLGRISDDLSSDFSAKLTDQLWTIRSWAIRLNLSLAFERGQLWRVWSLLKMIRLRHLAGGARWVGQRLLRRFAPRRAPSQKSRDPDNGNRATPDGEEC